MLMAEQTSKRIAIASDVRDRISNLPNGIIDHILDFLLVRDAARTSILSRKWRYVWASHPSIVLHPDRFEDGKVMVRNKFVSIITGIVLQHIGPIQKFSLKFPPIGSHASSTYSRTDHLLLFLSRNGIRDITLDDPHAKAYVLPPFVLSIPQLSHLRLTNCSFKSPKNFKGFHGLVYLKLVRVSFLLTEAATSVLSTPVLECLILSSCSGVCPFKFSAPKLHTLYICNNDDVDLSQFLISKHLQTAFVEVSVEKALLKSINFTKIFESWPVISCLCIDGPTLMGLAEDSELQTLPTTCSSLKHLVVRHIKFGDMHQIALILCLLRSSPFLTKLEISVDFSAENATESTSKYLTEPQRKVGITENLQTLTIESFNGTKAELLFVKLLLCCSPRLKTIAVQESRSFSHNEILSISKQLMRLPRASKDAVIVFEPDVKIPTYDDGFFTGVL